MPFKDSALPLKDILESVTSIEEFTWGLTFEAFERDLKAIPAVERKLQIISEAAIRLGGDAELLMSWVAVASHTRNWKLAKA